MKLFVTNLPPDATDAELAAVFARFGEVVAASVWGSRDPARPADRVGYVAVAGADAAALHGSDLRGRRLAVKAVVSRNGSGPGEG